MTYITTKDGTRIFYKDWGPKDAQPIVFHHGWPLSADDWDTQMLFFLGAGLPRDRPRPPRPRPLDPDRRPATTWTPMPPTSPSWSTALDLKNAIHVGHSTGGGEVARYVARAEPGRVAKAVLIDAVPPVMVKTDANPGGTADRGVRRLPRRARRQSRAVLPRYPERARSTASTGRARRSREGLIRNWWRQGMMGSAKAALRVHQGLLRDRLHRGPEGDRRAGAGDPQRGRPDRALCRFSPARGQAAEERHAQDLQGPAARLHATHPDLINADLLAFIRGDRTRNRRTRSWPSRSPPEERGTANYCCRTRGRRCSCASATRKSRGSAGSASRARSAPARRSRASARSAAG